MQVTEGDKATEVSTPVENYLQRAEKNSSWTVKSYFRRCPYENYDKEVQRSANDASSSYFDSNLGQVTANSTVAGCRILGWLLRFLLHLYR